MGTTFTVKPTPLNVSIVEEQLREMLMGWYEAHHPETHTKIKDNVDFDKYTSEDIKAMSAWRLDVEFRSQYLRQMAEACMQFAKPISDDVWLRDDLAYSTIKEAWDFFSEKRLVP